MKKAFKSVNNDLPSLPKKSFNNWDDFHDTLKTYESKYFLKYRVRSSESAEKHNSRKGAVCLPQTMAYSFKRMWCTHGATQASRGEGRRNHDSRFTGCEAGFLVRTERIAVDGQGKWEVRIVDGSEISLHNHRTTKTIYDSYRSAKSMPMSPEVRRELGLLNEMNTRTADINRYLSDKLDMVLTPQQTRNILHQVLGSTALARTKRILDAFAEADSGNDVLLVQDQMDISCVIAFQTSIQKKCFIQWGDTLVMDWTHGTNNLGYHLGSLVVTSATGRGVPVVDFLSVDQKAATMEYIVEFFKRKKSVVDTFFRDTEFVGWRVIGMAVPHVDVMLFQSYALT
ncbi:Hypothetical protein PHPALM_403 [Phytophthora palmivora]|uniref:MULE transposase domain-containing protein n=1 Tax=Phytophthora palmivora TaxID=4796 RepID=A0A2P4YUW8_9STRA|nr:Hypothetical protein PHPALM_403 [Phytophthora palmivora]